MHEIDFLNAGNIFSEIIGGFHRNSVEDSNFRNKMKPWEENPIWVVCGCEEGECHLVLPTSPFWGYDYLYPISLAEP